jgi:hypothetical protein
MPWFAREQSDRVFDDFPQVLPLLVGHFSDHFLDLGVRPYRDELCTAVLTAPTSRTIEARLLGLLAIMNALPCVPLKVFHRNASGRIIA